MQASTLSLLVLVLLVQVLYCAECLMAMVAQTLSRTKRDSETHDPRLVPRGAQFGRYVVPDFV